MKTFNRILLCFMVLGIFYPGYHFYAQEKAKEKPWTGSLREGRIIGSSDLEKILKEHEKWLKTDGKEGKKADLRRADLRSANMVYTNLQKADARFANLQNALLTGANLQDVNLWGANLRNADLQDSNLQNANLGGADLQNADLHHSKLLNAYLVFANLQETLFEIEPNNLPRILSIARARNLSQLQYLQFPHALVELRKAFKKSGLRKQEREITYAIKHSGFKNALWGGSLLKKIEVCIGWIFFELTCKWGMMPEKPLFILVSLIFLFSIPYMISIRKSKKKSGIWKIWTADRMRKDLGSKQPELLRRRWIASYLFAFYFSVLSAFNIGWRDLNIGNWLARIQPNEYVLRASGWPRALSGIQSLISVYLLALSVLTYFGRPFESY